MSYFMKILLVGADFFHAERRTDMTNLVAAFRNFAKHVKTAVLVRSLYQK